MTSQTRRRWPLVAAAGAFLTVLAAGGVSAALAGTAPQPRAALTDGRFALPPDAPRPPAGYRFQSVNRVVTGTQTYTCADGAWGTASVPEAQLHSYSNFYDVHHYAGPRWTSNRDGSTLLGTVTERLAKDGTIPWLLLTVTHEAPGEFDRVTHISRVNTTGGLAPTGACTSGETRAVPYGADYVFWQPPGFEPIG